jgi:tetratricopeptide (TPR) repeat protein
LALAFQPLNAEAYYQRGLAYRRMEDTSKAVSDYGRFLALAPAGDRRRSEVQLRRATLYESLKDYPAALRDLHQLTLVGCDEIVWQEQFARLCNNVAWHYVMEGPSKEFPGQALDLAEKARELGPYTFLFQNTLGAVYYRLGRYADAIGCLEEKLKKYPDYAAFDLYFLAMSYQRSGKSGSARSCYERANAWWSANPGLPAPYITELTSLRAEAAAVLGLSVPVDPPSKNDVRASR